MVNWAYALEANKAIKAMGVKNFMINERGGRERTRGEALFEFCTPLRNGMVRVSMCLVGDASWILGTEVAARSHQNTIASCSNASSSSTETIRQCDGKPTPRSLCDRTTGRLAFEPQVFKTPILATASTAVNKSIYSRHLAYTFQTLHCKLDLISPTWFNAMPQATEKNLITGSTAPQYFAHLAPPHRR